jgi:hypothetical protein
MLQENLRTRILHFFFLFPFFSSSIGEVAVDARLPASGADFFYFSFIFLFFQGGWR